MHGRLADLVFFELVINGAAADPEADGRLFFVPVAFIQDFYEQFFLVFIYGSVRSTCVSRVGTHQGRWER